MPRNILDIGETALLVVDVQEAFRSVIGDFALVASRLAMAVRGFGILERPVFVTEQYPHGLGLTAEEIRLALPEDARVFEKMAFSGLAADGLEEVLREREIRSVVIGGLETHVCVNQTVHELLEKGFEVHLLTDAVASRFAHDRAAGLQKMLSSGAVSSSVEMSLFELMRDAEHPLFKEVQQIIK